MTLDYKILWIDDREEFFGNHKSYIEDYLEELGFDTEIVTYKSFTEFKDNEPNATHQKIYDLFLIDLNLDHGETGDEIIQIIRENHILTDIIFYSTNLQDVRIKVNENNIEGVYITNRNRDDFEEKVTDVIDVTIKKVQDVNNLRGLIMAEVAELDRLKKSIIQKYTDTVEIDNDFKKYIKENIFNQLKSNIETYDYLIKDDESYKAMDLGNLVNELIYDSAKKARTVYKIKRMVESCSGVDYNFEEYKQCIVDKRNVLAHEEERIRQDGTKYLNYPNGNPLDFTEEHCIQIRKDIKKYKEILKNIEDQI